MYDNNWITDRQYSGIVPIFFTQWQFEVRQAMLKMNSFKEISRPLLVSWPLVIMGHDGKWLGTNRHRSAERPRPASSPPWHLNNRENASRKHTHTVYFQDAFSICTSLDLDTPPLPRLVVLVKNEKAAFLSFLSSCAVWMCLHQGAKSSC